MEADVGFEVVMSGAVTTGEWEAVVLGQQGQDGAPSESRGVLGRGLLA